ncbi:MAG: hypothetical protein Kapaf2KO_05300 [Candidatus Kapaibacteriales bacterium]
MKTILTLLTLLVVGFVSSFSTDIKTELKLFGSEFYSGDEYEAILEISNINVLAADEINVVMTVKDEGGTEVYNETNTITDLQPDAKDEISFTGIWTYGYGNFTVEFDAQFSQEIAPDNNKVTTEAKVKVGRADAAEIMINYGGAMVSDPDFNLGLIYLGQTPYESGTVFSETNGDFNMTTTGEYWGGYLETDKNLMFDKPGYMIFVDTESGEVTSNEIQSTPQTQPESLILSENNVVAGTRVNSVTYDWVDDYISKPSTDSVVNSRVCVLMVTGFKERFDSEESGFRNIANRFKEEISKEDLGPRVASQNIELKEQITGPELLAHIRTMRLKYDKIYFFYAGHGTKDNKLKTGSTPSDYVSYDDLMKELYDTKAEDLCIIVEACFSGQAIDAAKKNPDWTERNIEIFTSSDANSYSNMFQDSLNGQYIGFYTTLFFEGFGNPEADKNKDGKTTLKEAHDWVISKDGKFINEKGETISLNTSQDPQCDSNVDAGDDDLEKLAEIFKLAIEETYDEKQREDAVGRIKKEPMKERRDVKPDKPTKKLSPQDDVEPISVEAGEYFGWVDLNKYAKYGHATAYVTINLDTESWDIKEYDWYPEIVGDTTYNPFDSSSVVYGTPVEASSTIDTENIHQEATPIPKDSVCAITVSGSDKKSQEMEASFRLDCEMFGNNLKGESLGPKLDAGSVRNPTKPSFDELEKTLESMKGNYKKVYFYYSGHGTESGWLGINNDDWMSQKYLLERLMEIEAENFCIILDCCHSGKAKDLLDSINIPEGSEVELITACSGDRVSFINYHDAGNNRIGYGVFTLNFLKCFGFPDADTDKDGKTSLTEAFNWVKKVNPTDTRGRRIDTLLRPTHTIVRKPKATPSEPVIEDKEAGVKIEFTEIENEMEVDLKVSLSNYDYGSTLSDGIEYVAPIDSTSKIYEIDYTGTLKFKANIQFNYVDYLHSLPEENGSLQRGIIWREDDNDQWKAHLPSIYNQDEETITAIDVDHFSEWSIALVDINSSVDLISENNSKVYPNPFENTFDISFELDRDGVYKLSIIDLSGKIVKGFGSVVLGSGSNELLFHGDDLNPGTYYLEIKGEGTSSAVRVIKK